MKRWPSPTLQPEDQAQAQRGTKALPPFERRYYISSRELTAEQLAVAVRSHWAVENRLHWVLDVSFGEDASTIRKDNAPQNLSLLKKIVLNMIRLDTSDQSKTSLRLKRKRAGWDDDVRMKTLGFTRL